MKKIVFIVIVFIISGLFMFKALKSHSGISLETVSFPTHKDGRFIAMAFGISNGPATDCDKAILNEILRRNYSDGTLREGKAIEHEIRSRGIPIKIVEIVEGHTWGTHEFNTLYNGRQ